MARRIPTFSAEMEYLKFEGIIELIQTDSKLAEVCQNLHLICENSGNTNPVPIGFDCEWPVDPIKGSQKTSLIQICPNASVCYLFHLPFLGTSFPPPLKRLLIGTKFLKVGLAIEADFWKLERDFDVPAYHIIRKCCTDIGQLAKKVLPPSKEHWSLDGLSRHLLRKGLCKDAELRKGMWNETLNMQQLQYAANDAFASLLIYQKLTQIQQKSV